MKIVLQRVDKASVEVDNKVVGAINKGYLIFLGVTHSDNEKAADKLVDKIKNLRIFADSDGKTNLSLTDVGGEILVVSQFTLYASCQKGNRPSFDMAAKPDKAQMLYEYFLKKCRECFINVQSGVFGASMKISLVNNGPFTIVHEII